MINGAVLVRPGEVRTARAGSRLATLGLGSCVAVALYDPERRLGGLAHAVLPEPLAGRAPEPRGRFASSVIPWLLDLLVAEGADPGRIHARLAGGASMFPTLQANGAQSMGARNTSAARAALDAAGIPVLAEDVGGSHGRSVLFDVAEGRIVVKSVHFPAITL